jgi:hypothetical protein
VNPIRGQKWKLFWRGYGFGEDMAGREIEANFGKSESRLST